MIVAHAIHRYTPPAGWVVYDGDCGVCAGLARRFRRVLERRGFALVPLQSPWMSSRLRFSYGIPLEKLLEEMRVLTADGRALGGADAVLYLAGKIWWARPLAALGSRPWMRSRLQRAYRWFAERRHRLPRACEIHPTPPAVAGRRAA
ncbi:MAG: thiol-disulfide oxidoreductase DCC family protein [Terriglobales bacterium]